MRVRGRTSPATLASCASNALAMVELRRLPTRSGSATLLISVLRRPMADNQALILQLADILFEASKAGWDRLTYAEQVFLSVWELEAELNNGGFNQYFFNSAGDHAAQVSTALRSIGANNVAAIVDRALATFGENFSEDRDARREGLESIDPDSDLFDTLDAEFLAYPDDLAALLAAFVAERRSEIRDR